MSGFENAIRKKRTRSFTIALYESDGSTAVNVAANDRVRFKVYRGDAGEPYLDILSGTPAPGGSSVTPSVGTNNVAVKIVQDDTERMAPGAYDAEISLVDASDGLTKHAETGTIHVLESGGGNIGADDDDSSQSSSSSSSSSSST